MGQIAEVVAGMSGSDSGCQDGIERRGGKGVYLLDKLQKTPNVYFRSGQEGGGRRGMKKQTQV